MFLPANFCISVFSEANAQTRTAEIVAAAESTRPYGGVRNSRRDRRVEPCVHVDARSDASRSISRYGLVDVSGDKRREYVENG